MLQTAVSAIGAAAGFFFILSLSVGPRRGRDDAAERWLAMAVGLVALTMVDDMLIASEAYARAPWAFGWSYLALPLIAPALALHVEATLGRPARRAAHALAAAAPTLALAPWALLPGEARWGFETGAAPLDPRWEATASVSLMAYSAALVSQMVAYAGIIALLARRAPPGPARRWAATVAAATGFATLVFCGGLGAMALGAGGAVTPAVNAAVAATLYALAAADLARLRRPAEAPAEAAAPARYARSALADDEIARLAEHLAALERAGLHRDPLLTLPKLAAAAEASPNAVSQALNRLGGGFHDWVSAARVRDVQAQLSAPDGAALGLLDAAYAAGFNAKSTFYAAFRKETGLTPAAWRARLDTAPAAGAAVRTGDRA